MIARGCVRAVTSRGLVCTLPPLAIGASVGIRTMRGDARGTVVSCDDDAALVCVDGSLEGITRGAIVTELMISRSIPFGTRLLGRAIDADGNAHARARGAVREPLWTGVRAIDALLTIGRGARVGIFGSPGLGKSTLLETMVAGTRADAVVLGLIGERGREAGAWIERIGERTSIVCATSDRPAAERVRAARVAFGQARVLAGRGLQVLLVIDSLARFAAALRELAIGAGEATGRGGYPPSVFAGLAHLTEQAGSFERGSVTLVATVLDDGDARDPVSDAVRALLDGHIQLSARLAHAGQFPAIDVLSSASRTMDEVVDAEHRRAAATVREALALLERTSEARSLGLSHNDPALRRALAVEPKLQALLRQGRLPEPPEPTLEQLRQIADTLGEPYEHRL